MFWSCFLRAMLIIFVWSSINSLVTTAAMDKFDGLALLAIKDKITEDPLGALSSWNDSLHYCEWHGVKCSRVHRHRVTVLDLESQKLEGTLSPHIGNLTFLRIIKLNMNKIHGPIPQEVGHLFRLQKLYLGNNSFDGNIPTNLTHCSNLGIINLEYNHLSGGIPVELTSLSKLTQLYLGKNELKGRLPSLLGNLSSLTHLSLAYSSLTGSIPSEICHIRSLEFFQVSGNSLTGIVPSCVFNLSHITYFSITGNQLGGNLPPDIGLTLPSLHRFHVALNKFTGIIPFSLPNASRLEMIDLGANQFTGQLPRDLGRLQSLRFLSVHSNQLGSTSGDDLNFITSLTNCSNLERLQISNNLLKGSIPNYVANLSTKITVLTLGKNQIYGSIPAGIDNLVNLESIAFGDNHLTGGISKVIGKFPKMKQIFLDGNQFSGQIPDSFSNSTELTDLNLSQNKLHGRIPPSLGNCQNLFGADLSYNNLNGMIPKQVIGLSSLKLLLDLSNNNLSGSLPLEVGNLNSLVVLDISYNILSGHIPNTLGNCVMLVRLNMKGNFFEGKIPQGLSTLKVVERLDLSHNKLSGEIPEYLSKFTLLTYLDLSHNELEGQVPKEGVFSNARAISIVGNIKLCGGVVTLKLLPCDIRISKNKGKSISINIFISAAVVSLSLVLLLWAFIMLYRRRMSIKQPNQGHLVPLNPSPSWFSHQYMKISYAELLKATNNFSADNFLGGGSYGHVYRGVLDQVNTVIAVKVFSLQQIGASRSFLSECNALRNLRHRNLIKIITSCSSMDFQGNDFKALVLEFMPNGSLEELLHPKTNEQHEFRNLNFLQRVNIAIDIASALEYLHHLCDPAVIHCDIKPSNVLLDDDMTAHVADFGLAKIFSATSSTSQNEGSSLAIKGSIGYVPPEYGMGSEVSTAGDVYSYGILLLEMFTGKRPTDSMFQNGLTLHNFVKITLSDQVMNIVDPMMLLEDSHQAIDVEYRSDKRSRLQESLFSVVKLGITCSAEPPMERMDMREVVTKLCHIKDYLQGDGIDLQ